MLEKLKVLFKAIYEAAQPSRTRKKRTDSHSPNKLIEMSASQLRAHARYLERNHDLSRGALRTLVNNMIGANGIGIEPQPKRRDGTIHQDYAKALREAWKEWGRKPEVTHMHHWQRVQRMAAKTWLRDGEVFAQMLSGPVQFLDHGTKVPFSLEMFEPDMIPLDYSDGDRIKQGIEVNAWGRPVAYYVWKVHPLEGGFIPGKSDLKRIPTNNILQIATIDRFGQLRGASEFASVITRIEDIKDYEESERIAAKVAASMTAYIKRGSPENYSLDDVETDAEGNALPRDLRMQPGMIIDSLAVGEEIGMVDSNRPNPNLITFRQGQLRAIASGIGASYSSVSKDYNGSYSSQRQELVEQWCNYAVLTDDFTGQFVKPVWEAFVAAAHLSGVVRIPADVVLSDDAMFIGQSMPWIDPIKEANAFVTLVRNGFASETEVIRKRGNNPVDVLDQSASFRELSKERGIITDSDPANDVERLSAAAQAESIDEQSDADLAIKEENRKEAEAKAKAARLESEAAAISISTQKTALEAEKERLKVAQNEVLMSELALDELANG